VTTIWGIVSADGTPASGTGYKVFKDDDPGVYDISFDTSFAVRPAVVATELFPNQANSKGGDTRDNAVVVSIGTDRCRIVTGQDDGSHVNRDFSFVAIGN
jgi:hypothetical protein